MKKPLLFLLLPLAALLLPVSVIGVEFDGSECYYHLEPNSTLEVHYTHSVSLTKVVDVYQLSKNGIYFTKEMWQEFLAGQPIDFQYRQGAFYVKETNEFLGRAWRYWFIPVNNVTVRVNGNTVFVQPKKEGVLEIEVKDVPYILSIVRRC